MTRLKIKLPKNWGKCFDTAGQAMLVFPLGTKLCHGIGVATMPGQIGNTIAHAWLELDGIAYDTVWMAKQPAQCYRDNLKLSYVVEYTQDEAWELWQQTDCPGPWDDKIKEALKE